MTSEANTAGTAREGDHDAVLPTRDREADRMPAGLQERTGPGGGAGAV